MPYTVFAIPGRGTEGPEVNDIPSESKAFEVAAEMMLEADDAVAVLVLRPGSEEPEAEFRRNRQTRRWEVSVLKSVRFPRR